MGRHLPPSCLRIERARESGESGLHDARLSLIFLNSFERSIFLRFSFISSHAPPSLGVAAGLAGHIGEVASASLPPRTLRCGASFQAPDGWFPHVAYLVQERTDECSLSARITGLGLTASRKQRAARDRTGDTIEGSSECLRESPAKWSRYIFTA